MAQSVLISGAGLAGPAFAWWLAHHGFRPTVVELAPALRTGGSAVDYRGPVHLGLLERMGVLDELRAVATGGTTMRFVNEHGRRLMEMPSDFAGGDLEVPRGDLSRVLAEAGGDRIEWLFGDTITALSETPDGVDVTFRSGTRRTFDLAVGADGVHSAVRRLAFGPEQQFVRHCGYYVAGWNLPASPPGDNGPEQSASPGETAERVTLHYNVPGRLAAVGDDGAFVAFSAPEPLTYDHRDAAAQKQIVRERFAGLGWEVPRILAGLDTAGGFYFDAICQVRVPTWHRGRIVLLGDAAWGATIGGMGNGTALVGAYVLAGELAAAGANHEPALPRYQARMSDYVRRAASGGATTGRFLAPRTARGIRARNYLQNQAWFTNLTMRVANDRGTGIDLPGYPLTPATPRP